MLKTKAHTSKALGRKVEIRQLPALALEEILDLEHDRHGLRAAAVTCRHCVEGWSDRTVDDIMAKETADTLFELAEAVASLNPRSKKNSATSRGGDSSSDSH